MLALKTRGLHLGETAIDKQLRPRHVARIIRCEKEYCFGNLIRPSEPAERYYIRDHLQPLTLSSRTPAIFAAGLTWILFGITGASICACSRYRYTQINESTLVLC